MIDVFKIGIEMTVLGNAVGVLNMMQQKLLGIHSHVDLATGKFGALKMAIAGAMGVGAFIGIFTAFDKLIEKASGLQHALNILHTAPGVSEQGYQELKKTSIDTAINVPGTTPEGNAKLSSLLLGTLGSTEEVSKMMPAIAENIAFLHNQYGIDEERGGLLLAQAIDMRGRAVNPKTGQLDPDKFMKEMNGIIKALMVGGGDINLSDIRNLINQGRLSAHDIADPDAFWPSVLPLATDMRGNRAGTSMAAVYKALVLNKMETPAMKHWIDDGLADPSKVHFNKNHTRFVADQGALGEIEQVAHKDGLAAAIQKASDHLKSLKNSDGSLKFKDEAAINREIGNLFSNSTALSAAIVADSMRFQFERDKERYAAANPEAAKRFMQQNDYKFAKEKFDKSVDTLIQLAGLPIMQLATENLNKLSQIIRDLAKVVGDNPEGTKKFLVAIGAIGLAFAAGGAIAIITAGLMLLGGPLVLGLFAAGGVAYIAMEKLNIGLPEIATAFSKIANVTVGLCGNLNEVRDALANFLPKWMVDLLMASGRGLNRANEAVGNAGKTAHDAVFGWFDRHLHPHEFDNRPTSESVKPLLKDNPSPNSVMRGGPASPLPTPYPSFVLPMNYVPPANNNKPITINLTTTLDGRVLSKSVNQINANSLSRPQTGPTSFDMRQTESA